MWPACRSRPRRRGLSRRRRPTSPSRSPRSTCRSGGVRSAASGRPAGRRAYDAELAEALPGGGHGYLVVGVQRRPGQVEPGRAGPAAAIDLRLQPGEDAQVLRVALEAADARPPRRRAPAPRCARTAGGRCRAPGRRSPRGPGRRRARRRSPGRSARTSREWVSRVRGKSCLARGDHLGLAGEPAQRGAVQDPRAVPLERGAVARAPLLAADRFDGVPLDVRGLVVHTDNAIVPG